MKNFNDYLEAAQGQDKPLWLPSNQEWTKNHTAIIKDVVKNNGKTKMRITDDDTDYMDATYVDDEKEFDEAKAIANTQTIFKGKTNSKFYKAMIGKGFITRQFYNAVKPFLGNAKAEESIIYFYDHMDEE